MSRLDETRTAIAGLGGDFADDMRHLLRIIDAQAKALSLADSALLAEGAKDDGTNHAFTAYLRSRAAAKAAINED